MRSASPAQLSFISSHCTLRSSGHTGDAGFQTMLASGLTQIAGDALYWKPFKLWAAALSPAECMRFMLLATRPLCNFPAWLAGAVCSDGWGGRLCGIPVLQGHGWNKLGAECVVDNSSFLRPNAGLFLLPQHGGHHIQGKQATFKLLYIILASPFISSTSQRTNACTGQESFNPYSRYRRCHQTELCVTCAVNCSAAIWDHLHHPGHLGPHHFPAHSAGRHRRQKLKGAHSYQKARPCLDLFSNMLQDASFV